jgi:hypothetical protein
MPTTTVAHVYPLHNPQSADHAREAKLATTSWLFVIFGESHLAVLSLIDFIVHSPCSELPSLESISSKAVNFCPAPRAYSLVGGWVTSFLKPCHQKRRRARMLWRALLPHGRSNAR